MKKLLFLTLLCAAFGGSLRAQNAAPIQGGNISASSTNCTVSFSCVWESVLPQNAGTTTVNLAGTFVETLLVEESNNGGQTWSTAATLSATGTTTYSTNGFTDIRVRCSAFTSGSAAVTISTGLLQVQSVVPGGSSSSASSTGPVINVTNPIYAGGAQSSNADNNAAFTVAAAAYNTSVNAGIPGQSSIGAPVVASNSASSATTMNVVVTLASNTTTLVFVADGVSHHTFTITDNAGGGSSTFTLLGKAQSSASAGSISIYATAVSGQKAATQVTVAQSGGAENFAAIVMSYTGASLVYNVSGANGGASTSLAFSQTTTRAGSTIALGCGFFNSNVATFSATTGNARASIASSVIAGGILAMDNSSTPIGSVSLAGTFSASEFTACQGVEIQSFGSSPQQATLYVPAGNFVFSGGVSLTQPGTLKCEPGTVFYYTGSAHVVDFGIPGATITQATWPYYVDGCTFSGGQSATEGVFFNDFTIIEGVRNSSFVNFGPAATGASSFWGVVGHCDQWDFEIGPQVRFWTTDFIPRNYVRDNLGSCDSNSFLRVHDSEFYGLAGPLSLSNASLTNATQAGIGIYADGDQNIISLNSMGWLNPDILLACSGGTGVCYGTKIDNNIIDSQANCTGSSACANPIAFKNTQAALVIQHNNFDMQQTGLGPIGAFDGTGLLQGARINYNQASPIANNVPFVAMNNTVGQTSNQSSNNLCDTSIGVSGTFVPCPLPHTKGASINAFTFNNDDGHQASGYFVVGSTFTASGCANSTLVGGATGGTYTSVTAGSCTVTITMGDALTAAHGWACDAHDLTTVADANNVTMGTSTTTTANLVEGTVAASDVISFKCTGY